MPLEFMSVQVGRKKIYGVIHWPKEVPAPLVIGSHGLFSSKESSKFILLGEGFSEEGIAFLRYDHQGCGESEGELVGDPLLRLKDLESIFEFAIAHPLVKKESIGLFGSSLGGFISILKGAKDPRVKAVVLLATPLSLKGLKGVRKVDAKEEMRKVKNVLIIHGTQDEIVPFSEAQTLFELAQEPKKLVPLPEADHRISNPEDRLKVVRLSLDWFKRFL